MDEFLKILVIEDDEMDVLNIKRSLKKAEIKASVNCAEDGAGALALLERESFDCILLDYMLPDISGVELLKVIRSKNIEIPILIITSQGSENIAIEAYRSGASEYIPKSLITPEGISQSLRTVIRSHKADVERRRIEKELLESEDRYREITENSSDLIFIINIDGRFIYANKATLNAFHLKTENLQEYKIWDFVKNNHHPQILEILRTHNKFNKIENLNLFFVSQNKEELIGEGFIISKLSNTKQVEINFVFNNITEKKLSELELIKAKELAENSLKVKDQFLTNMSHEIRTPMNAIIGFAELLSNTKLTEEQTDFTNAIKNAGENLLGVINDILDFSKIESGKINLESIPFDLIKLTNSIHQLFLPKINDKKIKFTINSSGNIPPVIIGDPTRLNQILINLVGNAIKFTEKGEVNLSLNTTLVASTNITINFSIKDSGIGISPDALGKIFERFTQAANDTSRKYGGSGLGLNIVNGLLSLYNSKLNLQSTLGIGSIFSFEITFPISKTILSDVDIDRGYKHNIKGLNILLVEDNILNQKLALNILKNAGCNASMAENGREAIDLVSKSDFDLILMDIQMPILDGYKASEIIRKEMKLNVPIIAMTAHSIVGEKEKCLSYGMNDYISKPFKVNDLIDIIQRIAHPNNVTLIKEINNTSVKDCLFSLEYLNQVSGGDKDFELEMLELFIADSKTEHDLLKKAILEKDIEMIKNKSHRLKSTFSITGNLKVLEMLNLIELAYPYTTGFENIIQLDDKIQQIYNLITDEVNLLIKNYNSNKDTLVLK